MTKVIRDFSQTKKKQTTAEKIDEMDLSVAEFLEFEFYFELALAFQCKLEELSALKRNQPERFTAIAEHVLYNIVSPQCRRHLRDKITAMREQSKGNR